MTITDTATDAAPQDAQQAASRTLRKDFPRKAVDYKPTIWCEDCSQSKNGCARHAVISCAKCKQTITIAHKDLGYVNHGRVTERLLDADSGWYWTPMTRDEWPADPGPHGMWIWLHVAGFPPMPGYGEHEPTKRMTPGNRIKAMISDAIKNAAYRRGVATKLWAGEEFGSEEEVLSADIADLEDPEATSAALETRGQAQDIVASAKAATTLAQVNDLIGEAQKAGLYSVVLADGTTPAQHLKAAARRVTVPGKKDAGTGGRSSARPAKQAGAGTRHPLCACPAEQLLKGLGHDAGCPQAA